LLYFIDMDVETMSDTDTRGTYVFEVKHKASHAALQNAIVFAQQQLLKEVAKRGYNILLTERCVVEVLFYALC